MPMSAKTPIDFGLTTDDVFGLNWTGTRLGTRTISTVDAATSVPTGPTLTTAGANGSTVLGESGQTVAIGKVSQFRIQAGTAVVDTDYVATIKVTFSDGHKDERSVLLRCRAT